MNVIRVLPPNVVNRIAAGECVERPASVVKELVENALDAGAGRIDVLIEDGGRALIQVADDGCGMSAEDLRLCVEPHATSKIREDRDLFSIHTMGFRGEALPSIGSIARMRITTRPGHQDVGHWLEVDAGQIEGPTPCAAAPGTLIEVRDLFYCVPARRKFLRTNQTEVGHIGEQLARIAMAHPHVAFSLRHDKRALHDLPAIPEPLNERDETPREEDPRWRRIRDFFGPELADTLLPVSRESPDLRLTGFVAPPKESRGSSKWEYVFINGRYVRDRFVSHAIKEAYRSLIDPGRYPVAFLFLTVDPAAVDVNVHPTKIEVRWRDSNLVHGQTLAALRDKFLRTNLDRGLTLKSGDSNEHASDARQAMVEFFTRAEPRPREEWRRQGPTGRDWRSPPAAPQAPAEWSAEARPSAPTESATNATERAAALTPASASREAAPWPMPRALQIHDAYIVAETADGLMIIDQHALHERIMYEALRARVSRGPLESQRLLIPDIVPVAAERISALETHADALARLGIELTAAGPQSVSIQAFPSFLERVDRVAFVRDLLDMLSEQGARPEPDTLLHELLDMMACKAAIKAGDSLTASEITSLLEQREAADRSSNCPHGRPTTLRMTLAELERQFKRR